MAKSSKILAPRNEEELAGIVAKAMRERTPLEISGAGSRRGYGNPVQSVLGVSTSAMTGITLYEPAALTIVARAGTPLDAIRDALAAEGQHLPFEPADLSALLGNKSRPTIGGTVATGISGPRRIQAGAVRDSLIGVRFVDGTGAVIKNGGRVMKNVTGYDLVKMMCGSNGTLGVLTELSFKVLPRPRMTATLSLDGLDDDKAIAALAAALGSPFDITGAAHVSGTASTFVRIEGFGESVAYRAGQLSQLLAPFGKCRINDDGKANTLLWQDIRDCTAFADKPGAVWRLSVKPSDAPRIVAGLRTGPAMDAVYDWGGGLVWLLVPEEGDCAAAMIRKAVAASGGHATLVRAGDANRASTGVFQPEPAPVAAISAALRAKYDPAGILNPGRMGFEAPAIRKAG
ncbi:MAG: glycolate oxidase subunit GlcE [Nitratireductor sp.]